MGRKTRGLLAALLGITLALVVGLVPGLAKTARANDSLVDTTVKNGETLQLDDWVEFAPGQTANMYGPFTLAGIEYKVSDGGWFF